MLNECGDYLVKTFTLYNVGPVVAFGVKNKPTHFSSLMQCTLGDASNCCMCLNDVEFDSFFKYIADTSPSL